MYDGCENSSQNKPIMLQIPGGLHFYSTKPVVRDNVVVLSIAEPRICMALRLILVGECAHFRQQFEDLFKSAEAKEQTVSTGAA